MYFLARELIGIPGMRLELRAVQIHLKKIVPDEMKQKRKGSNAFEYHINSLPDETRLYLLQQEAKRQAALSDEIETKLSKDKVGIKTRDEIWYEFDNATSTQKEEAKERLAVALFVKQLLDREDAKTKREAIEKATSASRFSHGTIQAWFYRAPKLNTISCDDWLPHLLMVKGGKEKVAKKSPFSDEAQQFFKNTYLRPDVTKREAHRLTAKKALSEGWQFPSYCAVNRWLKSNVPHELLVLMREGKAAAHQNLVPHQRRTRMGMHAMELVNGDGHVARVQCELENGKIIRPMVWVFQDVFSSAIVGYSIDISENNEMLSIAIANMIKAYGLPSGWLFDRGSAALSDIVTGSMTKPGKDGKYKKFSSSELEGLLQMLGYTGADINWTGVIADNVGNKGNARGKPVERLFHSKGGMGQFERHPEFDGCYTGKDIYSKPANYEGGKRGVPFARFCQLFDEWVVDYNHQLGRRTEMARGTKSCQQVFDESYAVSQIRKPTPEQIRLCLLRQESVMVRESGVFELMASKYKEKTDSHYRTNRYQSSILYDYIGERISVRFNPYDMHSEVFAYGKDGRLLGAIPMIEDAGFNSLSAKRMQGLQQSEMKERLNLLEEQADLMSSAAFEEMVASIQTENSGLGSVAPGISEIVPLPKCLDSHKKVATPNGDDDDSDDDSSIINAMFNTFQPANVG